MVYIPVAKRNSAGASIPVKSIGGYVPVSSRTTPPPISSSDANGSVGGYIPVSKRPADFKPVVTTPAPAPIVETPKKPSIFSRTSDTIANSVERPANKTTMPELPANFKTLPPDQKKVVADQYGKDLETWKKQNDFSHQLPSAIVESLPFGLGEAFKQIHDMEQYDPTTAQYIDNSPTALLKEVPKATLDVGKGFVKAPISGALDIAGITGKQIKFNIPGLGEVSNAQYRAATRVANGEDPVKVSLEEGSGAILDTLFFLSLAAKPFQGRPITTAKSELPADMFASQDLIKSNSPRSFRLYEPRTSAQPLTPEFIAQAQSQGIDLGPKFDPNLPTYFKTSFNPTGAGSFIGEVVQIRPSYFSMLKGLAGTKADPGYTYTVKDIGNSGHDLDRAIEAGDMPMEKVYKNKAGDLQPAYADHVVSDLAGKLDDYRPGLGAEFKNSVDLTHPTPTSLDSQALKLLNSTIGKKILPDVIPLPSPAQIKGTPPTQLTVLTTQKVTPEDVQKGLKAPIVTENAPTSTPATPEERATNLVNGGATPVPSTANEFTTGQSIVAKGKTGGTEIPIKVIRVTPEGVLATDSRSNLQTLFKKEDFSFKTPAVQENPVGLSPEVKAKNAMDQKQPKTRSIPQEKLPENPPKAKGSVSQETDKIFIVGEGQRTVKVTGRGSVVGTPVFTHFEEAPKNTIVSDAKTGKQINTIVTDQKTGLSMGTSHFKVPKRAIADVEAKLLEKTGSPEKLQALIKDAQAKFYESDHAKLLKKETAKTQKAKVAESVKEAPKTIKEIAMETKIKEPNIRRILGVGAKEGVFERVDKGVYILSKDGKDMVWIEANDALESVKRLAKEGFKADMIFLDPPYNLAGNRGGNRMNAEKKTIFETISPEEFGGMVGDLEKILRDENKPLVYMVSQSASSKKGAERYTQQILNAGFIPVAKGDYFKMTKDGKRFTKPLRPEPLDPEAIYIFNKSGKLDVSQFGDMQFKLVRPKGYQTEKPAELLKQLITMTTNEGDMILDPFAGSGVTGAEAVKAGRKAHLIEKNASVVENITKPRVEKALAESNIQEKKPTNSKEFNVGDVFDMQGNSNMASPATIREISGNSVFFTDANGVDYSGFSTATARELVKGGEWKKIEKAPVYTGGGKGANIGNFADGTPIEAGGMDKIHPIEFPELVDLARELQKVPDIAAKLGKKRGVFRGDKGITLRADIFENPEQAAKTLAHEIGHLVDFLPDGIMARGNLLGRLHTLKKFLKNKFGAEEHVTNKDLREELFKVTQYWRPYDEAKSSPSYVRYRRSADELYADAISMLFNTPGTLEKMAPKFYEEFFKALDQKPEVFNAFFELQDMLGGDRAKVIEHRRAGVRGMFGAGDMKAADIQRSRIEVMKARKNDILFQFKFNVIDKNYAMIDRLNVLKKTGVNVSDDENPLYYLEERNYLGGKIKAFMEKNINPIYQNLQKNEISWTDFGEALFYDRIRAGDRSTAANPRGITPKVSEELLTKMLTEMGPEKGQILVTAMEDFRNALKTVTEEAFQEGLYKPEMHQQMQANPAYATFQVLDHLEEGMTSKIHKSIGTLKDIANPADASLLKTISTFRAIEKNKVTRSVVEFLQKNFTADIKDAKVQRTPKGLIPMESKLPNENLVTYMKDGKRLGYYVDPYIQQSIDNENIGHTISILRIMNSSLFRPLFITYNPGFQAFNFLRDFQRFWKNTPTMTIFRALRLYRDAIPVAKARAWGITTNEMLQKLEADQILSVTYNQLTDGADVEDKQIDNIMKSTGIDSFQPKVKYQALQPFVKILDFIKDMGDFVETLPKVAGYLEFSKGGTQEISREQKSFIRKNIGSPDFLAGGYWKPLTNELFLFSNAITQGIRSDVMVATDPKTRSGYWYKTAKKDMLPKVLMLLAALGFFGETVKEIMNKASEYDKANYGIIPLGTDSKGKAVYLRLPQDEGGRLIGGLTWKLIDSVNNKQGIGKDITDIASFSAGQLPNISPSVTVAVATGQFLSGVNPYDTFRSRNVLTDDQFKAGGMYAAKPFLGWLFNQSGGGVFYQYTQTAPRDKSTPEKIFGLPLVGNIAGRFIKVSDYGQTEKLNQIKADVQSDESRQRLDENAIINKYIGDAQGAQDAKSIEELTAKNKANLVNEILGHAPQDSAELTRANNIIKKYQVGLQRGESDPNINALISAVTNQEKVALVQEFKATMTKKEFNQLLLTALKYKIASPEVFINATKPATKSP